MGGGRKLVLVIYRREGGKRERGEREERKGGEKIEQRRKRIESTHSEFRRIRVLRYRHIDLDIIRCRPSLKLSFHLSSHSH